MGIFVGDTAPDKIFIGANEVASVWAGDVKVRPSGPRPGIYHNAKLGLISITADLENRLTIFDKNISATKVYDGGAVNADNCGWFYQWGNCFGFPFSTNFTLPSLNYTNINIDGFSSSKYLYISTPFNTANINPRNSKDLWGETVNTSIARRGPCQEGFHIASKTEWEGLISLGTTLGFTTGERLKDYLLMPLAGRRTGSSTADVGTYGYYRSSTRSSVTGSYNQVENSYGIKFDASSVTVESSGRATGKSIRPFKNEAVIPDDTRTVLYSA